MEDKSAGKEVEKREIKSQNEKESVSAMRTVETFRKRKMREGEGLCGGAIVNS